MSGAKAQAKSSRCGNQAAQRALAVLSLFAGAEPSRGVSELSRACGVSKNMMHRILATLSEAGYLVRDPTGKRYQLGYRVLDLSMDDAMFDFRSICRPALEHLHALTGESVFLSIIVGGSRVNVDWIEAPGRRMSSGERGRSVPLHCSRMSRILLAHLTDPEIAAYLSAAEPLDRLDALFPDAAPTTPGSVWADVRAMRDRSCIIWNGPKQFGGAYAAFPVAGDNGRLHGILTIGGPIERFESEAAARRTDVSRVIQHLREQCSTLTPPPVFVTSGMLP